MGLEKAILLTFAPTRIITVRATIESSSRSTASNSVAGAVPMASSSAAVFPGQWGTNKLGGDEREKRMGEILQGKFFYLDHRFLDRFVNGIEISEKLHLEVGRLQQWTTYNQHTRPAPANNERGIQADSVVNRIVRLYKEFPTAAPLRKQYLSSGSSEVRYHAMSVASLANVPEAEANRNLKPDLYSRVIPA